MSDSAKRVRWRCRRGIRELDLLLETYFSRTSPSMTKDELHTFERFLDTNDMDLYAWLTHRKTPTDDEFVGLVETILSTRVN